MLPTTNLYSAVNVGPHSEYVRRVSGWIATALDVYCDLAATARPAAVHRTGPGAHEATPLPWGHALQRLLRRPCGPQLPQSLWQRLVLRYWLATGNVYLYRQRIAERTIALWPLATHHVTPEIGPQGTITHIYYVGHDAAIPRTAFVHLRRPNVLDPYGEGLSPIGEHALSVEIADNVDQVRALAFRSPKRPNLIFAADLPLTDDDVARNEARLTAKWGGIGNEGRPLFLDSGLKLIGPSTITPHELDYLTTTRVTREEVLCGIYRVPPLLAGYSDAGVPPSEGLIRGATTLFAQAAVDPLLYSIYDQLLEQLADPDQVGLIEPRIASVAPLNRNQERADEAVDRRESLRTVNEIRIARGFTPLPEAWADDAAWRPGPAPSNTADPAPDAQPTDAGHTPPGPRHTEAEEPTE